MISKLKGDIKLERWAGEAGNGYPSGLNPWFEIYTHDTTAKIAETIELEDNADVDALRLQLAATAEYLLSVFNFVGGAATPAQKHAWATKIDVLSRRLMAGLDDSDDHLSSVVLRSGKDKSSRFVPASELRRRVQSVETAVSALLELVQSVSEAPRNEGTATSHAETMQLVVNGMTEVFIDFRGIERVKRTATSNHIDGEFPEFVRASARPILAAYYLKFSKDPTKFGNLNRQIQTAVSVYRSND